MITTSTLYIVSSLARWSAVAFLVLLFLLHFIKPEFSPSWHFISEYQLGSYGWLMSLAFLSLALSCTLLTFALWPQLKNILGRIGLLLLLVSACGMVIAAIFITDPLNTAKELWTEHGKLHQWGAILDSIPVASLLITPMLLRKNEKWRPAKTLLVGSTVLVWLGLIQFIVSMAMFFPADGKFGPDVPLGWPNRIMIISQCIWLILVAGQSAKINSDPKTIR